MTDILEQELQDSVLELTINREDAGNALSNEVIGLLNDSLMQHRSRRDLKCALIKGSGEKFFVAGGDLKELTSVKEDYQTEAMALNGRAMLDQIRYFPVPVIAKINGMHWVAELNWQWHAIIELLVKRPNLASYIPHSA